MLFSQDIGVDLGTANTLVFVKGKGIVIREPSVVAVDERTNPKTVVAVGADAKRMIGRTPGSITAVRPIKDGVIAEKKAIDLPEMLVNVIKCKNPRCITTTEQEIEHIFKLTDKEKGVYRCIYCEVNAKE